MISFVNIMIIIAIGSLVIVVGSGLWNMFKGKGNRNQTLKRARVIVQFIAVLLLVIIAFFATREA